MLTTEEEAKTKRCQEGFHGADLGTGYMEARPAFVSVGAGAYGYATAPTNCIGSGCMAWRWHMTLNDDYGLVQSDKGYCGKAGAAA